jgi:acetylglutamate kinase
MHDSPDIQEITARAHTLVESLPWLKHFRGQVIVVKFGGNAMVDQHLERAFAEDMVFLHHVGIHPVVIHGGGPQISAELERRGIPSEFRGGLRVTSPAAMDVVREVLTGQVGRQLAAAIDAHGDLAQQLSGESAGLFSGRRRGTIVDGEQVDLGLVGEVIDVDATVVRDAIAAGRIPVVSSIAPDVDDPGHALNVNADSAAASLAVALGAAKLVMLTDVAGLYRNWPDRDSLVSQLTVSELADLLPGLEAGMIPKMTACLDAVTQGVPKAAIIDGRVPHSTLVEVFSDRGVGTEVVPDSPATQHSPRSTPEEESTT